MVSAEAVWSALAEVEDPEIPVISLVDLGVIRDVKIADGRVHVEFTPTFLGCPALEVMRDQMAAKIEELGAEADVEVVMDDSWSTDRITPEGREKLRAAGFAPPAPREATAPKLVQLPERGLPLPVLRLDRDEAGEHLRPDPVPLDPLLLELPPAVRAVQDDLTGSCRRTEPEQKGRVRSSPPSRWETLPVLAIELLMGVGAIYVDRLSSDGVVDSCFQLRLI